MFSQTTFHKNLVIPAFIGAELAGGADSTPPSRGLNILTDQDKNWAQGFSACELCFFLIHLIKKNYWLLMLSMEPALLRQCISLRLRLPAVTYTAIRNPFISPAHLTKPERWHLPYGSINEGVVYCAMSHFLNIRSQWQDPEISIFCYYERAR